MTKHSAICGLAATKPAAGMHPHECAMTADSRRMCDVLDQADGAGDLYGGILRVSERYARGIGGRHFPVAVGPAVAEKVQGPAVVAAAASRSIHERPPNGKSAASADGNVAP